MANFTRSLDPLRPITSASNTHSDKDQAVRHLDVIGFNRYNSWYANTGRTNMITDNVVQEAIGWHTKFQKPVLMFEYGSDAIEGMHTVCTRI